LHKHQKQQHQLIKRRPKTKTMAPMATDVGSTGRDAESIPLNLDSNNLSADSLNLKDEHGMQTSPCEKDTHTSDD
jgi:hypothetical protein